MGIQRQYGALTPEQEKLVISNIHRIHYAAGIMYKHYSHVIDRIPMTYDDFAGVASLYLCIAAKNYDPTKGSSFPNYAIITMMGGIKKQVMRKSSLLVLPRIMTDKKLSGVEGVSVLSFDQPYYQGKDGSTITIGDTIQLEGDQGMSELMQFIDQVLKGNEKRAFIACKIENRSQKETADELGMSQMNVSRIIRKATEKLRRLLVA